MAKFSKKGSGPPKRASANGIGNFMQSLPMLGNQYMLSRVATHNPDRSYAGNESASLDGKRSAKNSVEGMVLRDKDAGRQTTHYRQRCCPPTSLDCLYGRGNETLTSTRCFFF
mmetsp:Transcript_20015/g.41826  ORF Transcript_20015/g.41826 Transcript_20015/m.41826 type:complete len:113 (+) Transcript_20015:480-818(+)